MERPTSKILFSRQEIATAVESMAEKLNALCTDGPWLVLCVLNGGLMITSDILMHLRFPVMLDSVLLSRYQDTTHGSELKWHARPKKSLESARIILIDDIFDEGETMSALVEYCLAEGATSVVSAVLLDKVHDRKKVDFRPDIVGLSCADEYVFGYGMDIEGFYRNLPEIHYLPDSD